MDLAQLVKNPDIAHRHGKRRTEGARLCYRLRCNNLQIFAS